MTDLLKDFPFVALDIETTGLTPVVDRIVEIGAIKFRNKIVLDTFQELIDPKIPISPGAFVYQDAGGSVTNRQITPLAVGFFSGTVMIDAFSHLRQDKRNFRLDRILEIL